MPCGVGQGCYEGALVHTNKIGRHKAFEVLLVTLWLYSCASDKELPSRLACSATVVYTTKFLSSPAQVEVPCVELQTRLMPVTEAR